MFFWYKFLSYLFYPFSYFFLLFRKLKKKEDKNRYLEKIAKIKIKRKDGFLVWFHVASVGEAMSILPLVENLKENEKINTILITSITLSSGQILEKKYHIIYSITPHIIINIPKNAIKIKNIVWILIFYLKNMKARIAVIKGIVLIVNNVLPIDVFANELINKKLAVM